MDKDQLAKRRASNLAAVRAYQAAHVEEVAARKALWYQLNKVRRRAVQKAWDDARKAERAEEALRSLEGPPLISARASRAKTSEGRVA